MIDLVLTGQHPKLRERCLVDRIVPVLEDSFGAYDAAPAGISICAAVLARDR